MITFPLWFKIFLGLFCFLIFTGTFRRFSIDKIVISVEKLPIEKKEKFLGSYQYAVKIHKILLYMIPINMIAVPYAIYKYQPDHFFHTSVLVVLVYVMIVDDLSFRQSVLKKVK